MFVARLIPVRHKLVVYQAFALKQFCWQRQVEDIHFVKNEKKFIIDLMYSDQLFKLYLLCHKLTFIYFNRSLTFHIFDTLNAPGKGRVDHHNKVIPYSHIFLHIVSLHHGQMTEIYNFFITFDLVDGPLPINHGNLEIITGKMEEETLGQLQGAFH